MINKILNKINSGSLNYQLKWNSLASFVLKVSQIGLSFITSILLARLLGVEGYGAYAYVVAWFFLLEVPAGLGLRILLPREIAIYETHQKWSLMRGIIHWANQSALLSSVAVSFIASIIAWYILGDSNPQMLYIFWLGIASLPFFILTILKQSIMRGLHQIILGQLSETIIQPILFIFLIISTYLFSSSSLNLKLIMAYWLISFVSVFFISTLLLNQSLPNSVKNYIPEYNVSNWWRSVLPFIFVTSMFVINNRTDAIMLGIMQGNESVGLYNVANRGAMLISFILVAVNQSLAPSIAKLYAEGNLSKLQSIITKSSRTIIFGSLPIALILIIFGKWFLLIFGSEFTAAYLTLVILSFGQLINATMGSVGLLLDMTGHERDTAVGVGTTAILNIILNALFIPIWGVNGAAIATAISTIAWNIILFFYVKKRLGITPSIVFG